MGTSGCGGPSSKRRPALGGGDSLPLPAWGRVYRRKGLSSHKAILTPKGRFPCPYGFGVCMVFVCLWLLKCPQPAAGWQVFCSAGFVARLICPDCAVQVNRAGRESWLSPPHVALLGSVEDTGRGADPSDDSSARGARAKLEEMQVAHPRSTGPVPVSFASLDVDFSGPFPPPQGMASTLRSRFSVLGCSTVIVVAQDSVAGVKPAPKIDK